MKVGKQISDAIFHKIHNEGYKFIAISIFITFILLLISKFLGFIGLLFTIWVYFFFRDPNRTIPLDGFIVSPADGTITYIGDPNTPFDIENNNQLYTKVSIFLSIFDVHVNRMPIDGTIKEIKYIPGKFINATLDKSSKQNEKNIIKINNGKYDYFVVQIAGLIARRIVCNVNINQDLKKGERIGIIKFGSRVDLYLPKSNKVLVSKGQKVIGGETIISNPENIQKISSAVIK